MLKYLKEYRFYIILFIFILLPIIAIDTSTRSPRQYTIVDRTVVAVTAPLQTAISWTLETVVAFFHNYLFLLNTRKDNLALLKENRNLINTIIDLQETQKENLRLRKLLDFKEKLELKTVVARVIAKDVSTEFRTIRINRGTDDGIQKDMAVVNDQGIVGRILRATADTADVVTILDLLSAVDSVVRRSRVRGIVEGMTDEICQLKFALRTDDIVPGDVLISSGLGGIFPKGIPVGTVSDVTRKKYGITQSVEVRPSVDFSRLEEVLVLQGTRGSPLHIIRQNNIQIPIKNTQAAPAITPQETPKKESPPEKDSEE